MDKFWKPLAESLSEPKDVPTLTIDDIEKHLEELKTIKPEYDPVADDMLKRYVDALVKCTETSRWSGSFWLNKQDYLSGDVDLKISCKQYIRGFPFVPKTFCIDVIEEEVEKDDWEMFLKEVS